MCSPTAQVCERFSRSIYPMLNIPEDKLPQDLKDEDRINSLFSPLRSRTVNPKDWDTKLSSWKNIIYLYCANNKVFSFSLPELRKTFIRNGRPPSCLDIVFEELVKTGELQSYENFIKESPRSWSGWATDLLVRKPISWSWNLVKRSVLTQKVNEDQVFVHVRAVETEAQKLFALIPAKSKNKLMPFSEVLEILNTDSQVEDIKLLLHYLSKERKVAVTTLKSLSETDKPNDIFLVKFGEHVTISESDTGVYGLEQNECLIKNQIESLEDEIENCTREVKSHLLKSHRQLAKTCLKRKHELEKRLDKKINVLSNIQVLLERVRDVHTDAAVLQAYKTAITTFNNTVNETGLSEDSVEDTILRLGEMMDIQDDIQSSLSKPVGEEHDSELEEELRELMKLKPTDEEKKNTDSDLDKQFAKLDVNELLPNVPSQNISILEASLNE